MHSNFSKYTVLNKAGGTTKNILNQSLICIHNLEFGEATSFPVVKSDIKAKPFLILN
jgi:hypothetical protein